MWTVLWGIWRLGKETKIDSKLDFTWATSPKSEWERNSIFHNAGVTITSDAGRISWNDIDGTFNMGLYQGVSLQLGQEENMYGKAISGISNGDVVMFAGVQGDHVLFAKADPSVINQKPQYIIGVATQNFIANQFGYVTILGKVRNLNTSAYSGGTILYFNSTGSTLGGFTSVEPTAPNAKIIVAAVLSSHATQGVILVRPTFSRRVSDIQDVQITNIQNNDIIQYSSSLGYFVNTNTPKFSSVSATTMSAVTFTGNLTGLASLATSATTALNSTQLNGQSASYYYPSSNPSGYTTNTGTVTGVNSGNGMDFTNFTTSGTITLGKPSSLTLSSTNSVTTNSHTHAFAPGGTTAQYITGAGTLATFPTIVNTFVTGATFNSSNNNLTLTRNDGVNIVANLNISTTDVYVTGGTYNNGTGTATFINNTGGTFNVTGFTTGGTASLTGYVTTNTTQTITGNKTFNNVGLIKKIQTSTYPTQSGGYFSIGGIGGYDSFEFYSFNGTDGDGFGSAQISSNPEEGNLITHTSLDGQNSSMLNINKYEPFLRNNYNRNRTTLSLDGRGGKVKIEGTINKFANLGTSLITGTKNFEFPNQSGTLALTSDISGTTNYIPKFTGTTSLGDSRIFDNGTNVGFGTITPNTPIDISHNNASYGAGINITNTNTSGTAISSISFTQNSSTGYKNGSINLFNDGRMDFLSYEGFINFRAKSTTSSNAVAMYIDNISSTSRVTIGPSNTASHPLRVTQQVSNVSIYADYDIVAFSDQSVKENIRPIKNVIERIENSRGILYDRVDSGSKDNIGFIAQELEQTFPELVTTNEDGTKAVKYQNAVAVLFEGIKEQQKQIDELKDMITKLINDK